VAIKVPWRVRNLAGMALFCGHIRDACAGAFGPLRRGICVAGLLAQGGLLARTRPGGPGLVALHPVNGGAVAILPGAEPVRKAVTWGMRARARGRARHSAAAIRGACICGAIPLIFWG